ncbi:MAG: hypothetical protein ACRD1V_06115 [Vicinamibacterales bacterium]
MRQQRGLAPVFVLIMIGSIGFLNLMERPRFQLFHTVDVVQLLATGMCYGVALAWIFVLARKTGA